MYRLSLLMVLALGQLSVTVANLDELYESMAPTSVPVEPEELDTSEPVLWQMAAFGARQMSREDKRQKFKLVTLSGAERLESIYKLRVTLQRVLANELPSKRDILYCTLEVKSTDGQQPWTMKNFGCTIPALIRRRRPMLSKPVQTGDEFDSSSNDIGSSLLATRKITLEPLSNSIDEDLTGPKVSSKRSPPMLYRTRLVHYMPYQRNYQPPVFHPRYL